MKQPIKVPSVGESVTQATIGEWQKKTGNYVQQNEVLVVLETDKASMDLVAESSGQLNILKNEGEDVQVGEVIAELDTSVKREEHLPENKDTQALPDEKGTPSSLNKESPSLKLDVTSNPSLPKLSSLQNTTRFIPPPVSSHDQPNKTLSPAVQRWVTEHKLDPSQIIGTGPRKRITKKDVIQATQNVTQQQTSFSLPFPQPKISDQPEQTRKKMTTLRRRIAERLVASQQSTATLTTFNEVDMSEVIALRTQYKESFQKQYNIKLGFMGFFIRSVIKALESFPQVNAFTEGREIVYNNFPHIGVAVSTDRGLVVPVIRYANQLSLAELEKSVASFAEKAREGKLSPDDLSGGTFTISNGGVFGSLMSTPILNPPQSGILGMHKIEQRPIAKDGNVVIKPMMYVALSYDHRIVDGRESVSFLQIVKECVENPIRLLIDV